MTNTVHHGDCLTVLKTFPDEFIDCCVTSPPYWGLRDYGVSGQLGLEKTPEEYVAKMVEVFREVRRVLRKDGTLWLNLGDSYAGSGGAHKEHHANPGLSNSFKRNGVPHWGDIGQPENYLAPKGLKPKDLVGIPWRVAFALQADGWYLRSDIIWHKPNPMPESVTDRPTKSHEYIFLMSKSAKYYFDQEAVREPHLWAGRDKRADGQRHESKGLCETGNYATNAVCYHPNGRNVRTVWTIPTQPTPEAHFATFPEALIVPCIKAGTSEKGCCPECGSPWERVIEREGKTSREWQKERGLGTKGNDVLMGIQGKSIKGGRPPDPIYNTLGWQPTCNHNLEPIPCTVLDPFFGSGTTGIVAKKLNRKWIGIELNAEYIKIAEKRIEKECGLLI